MQYDFSPDFYSLPVDWFVVTKTFNSNINNNTFIYLTNFDLSNDFW